MADSPIKPGSKKPKALLIGLGQHAHYFDGVAQALSDCGVGVTTDFLQRQGPVFLSSEQAAGVDVIVHRDCVKAHARKVVEAAGSENKPTVLLMDGVLEYANTFLNQGVENQFLRPAPADVVLASGEHDRRIFEALGNRASATGLVRLNGFADRVKACQCEHQPDGLLVATANQPAFTAGGRARLLASLKEILEEGTRNGFQIRWRIDQQLAQEIGVAVDQGDLAESLASVQAVLTSASTLAIESMLANKPTGIIHPHPWPLWIPTAWRLDGSCSEGVEQDLQAMKALDGADKAANKAANDSIQEVFDGAKPIRTSSICQLIDALFEPCDELRSLQDRIVQQYACEDSPMRAAKTIECAASMS
ncbi:hypothetical protein COB72_00045 [bacterium]|nr:MAG: hypothetical protein COB72_00045 [bacterium]